MENENGCENVKTRRPVFCTGCKLSTKFKLRSKGKYLYLVSCKSLIDDRKFKVKTRANDDRSAVKKVRRSYGKKYEYYASKIYERSKKLC